MPDQFEPAYRTLVVACNALRVELGKTREELAYAWKQVETLATNVATLLDELEQARTNRPES